MDESIYRILGRNFRAPYRLRRPVRTSGRRSTRVQRGNVETMADGHAPPWGVVNAGRPVVEERRSLGRKSHHSRLDLSRRNRRLPANNRCALETNHGSLAGEIPLMSPSHALHDPIFLAYLRIIFVSLFV